MKYTDKINKKMDKIILKNDSNNISIIERDTVGKICSGQVSLAFDIPFFVFNYLVALDYFLSLLGNS